MRLIAVLVLALLPFAAGAQDRAETLADIKAQLATLTGEFNALKQELVATGAAQSGAAGGDALQRLDAIEAELVRLTAKTEEVELRLNRVVNDGTLRVNDLTFRVVELEGGDLSTVGQQPPIGGDTAAVAPAPPTDPATTGPELAVGQQADFDRAREVLGTGDFRGAADLFATFAQTYPGSPLTQEAQLQRGDALGQLGETSDAARAYLEAFSSKPDGARAGEALLKLGQSLGTLGQTPEACVTLGEVGVRFPGSIDATNAQVSMQGLGCQ
jgi:tol-pal system protein YbgF